MWPHRGLQAPRYTLWGCTVTHSSYRAELAAIVLALRWVDELDIYVGGVIYTDSLSALIALQQSMHYRVLGGGGGWGWGRSPQNYHEFNPPKKFMVS